MKFLIKRHSNMILKSFYSRFNYRYILYLALTAFLFISCQTKDPLEYLQKESISLGYKKVTSTDSRNKFQFGENSIMSVGDSIHNLSVLLPEIMSGSEFEVYYSFFNEKDYSVVIICDGLGETLKKKMIYEKQVSTFDFKEIYNDQNSFVSPLDENTVLISSNMDDIRKAIKRGEGKSVLANESIKVLKKEIPENSKDWFITTDNKTIAVMANPFVKDSASSILKNSKKYKSLVYYNDGKASILIDGEENNLPADQIVKEIKAEISNIDYNLTASKAPGYKFTNFDITNNNNKFRIIIK